MEVFVLEIDIDKKVIISAIQRGLSNAQTEIYNSNTITENRKHMEKWDKINTCVYDLFYENDRFTITPLDRGLFKLLMIFDNKEHTLFTIIKKDNFNKLLNRKTLSKAHYIDSMFDYNYLYQKNPMQISIFDAENMFSEGAERQIKDLQTTIENLLLTDSIKKYITIVVDFKGFTLTEVHAVLGSKWLEIIETDDWSEYINPSFDDIEDNGRRDYVQSSDLKSKISIKPSVRKQQEIG